jgi:uncharacterized low-complexity protein
VEELSSAPEAQGAVLSSLPKVARVWHCVSFAAVLISIWDEKCAVGKLAVGKFVTERCEVRNVIGKFALSINFVFILHTTAEEVSAKTGGVASVAARSVCELPVGKCVVGRCAVGKSAVGKCTVGKCAVGKCEIGKCTIGKCAVSRKFALLLNFVFIVHRTAGDVKGVFTQGCGSRGFEV